MVSIYMYVNYFFSHVVHSSYVAFSFPIGLRGLSPFFLFSPVTYNYTQLFTFSEFEWKDGIASLQSPHSSWSKCNIDNVKLPTYNVSGLLELHCTCHYVTDIISPTSIPVTKIMRLFLIGMVVAVVGIDDLKGSCLGGKVASQLNIKKKREAKQTKAHTSWCKWHEVTIEKFDSRWEKESKSWKFTKQHNKPKNFGWYHKRFLA